MRRKLEYCEFGEKEVLKLKTMLGIDLGDETKNAILQFSLDDAIEVVKEYCNEDNVPKGLYNTVLRMAIDLYRNESLGEETTLGSISSISEGDTSISYRSSATEFKDSILKDYKSQLNKFRKLRW